MMGTLTESALRTVASHDWSCPLRRLEALKTAACVEFLEAAGLQRDSAQWLAALEELVRRDTVISTAARHLQSPAA